MNTAAKGVEAAAGKTVTAVEDGEGDGEGDDEGIRVPKKDLRRVSAARSRA